MKNLERITINPQICHGKPCIRGMRWPVVVLLGLIEGGMTFEEIMEDHPEIELEDIYAALRFARLSVSGLVLNEQVA